MLSHRRCQLCALAVASARSSVLAPGLPTAATAGVPGFETGTLHGLFAPARTPEATIARLHQETVRFLNRTDTKERLFNAGLEMVGSSPSELLSAIRSETARIAEMIRKAAAAAR